MRMMGFVMTRTLGTIIDESGEEEKGKIMEKKRYKVTFEVIIEVEAMNESEASDLAEEKWNMGDFDRSSLIEAVLRRR